jgi:hypothetical protein
LGVAARVRNHPDRSSNAVATQYQAVISIAGAVIFIGSIDIAFI